MIYVHPTEGLPQEASLTWDLSTTGFSGYRERRPTRQARCGSSWNRTTTSWWWKNFLKNPTIPTLVEVLYHRA